MISASLFEKIKTAAFNSADSIRDLLLTLGVIIENVSCTKCTDRLVIHFDATKPFCIRYWCGRCSRRYDVRKFTPFSGLRLQAIKILQIIALFADGKKVSEIVDLTDLAPASV